LIYPDAQTANVPANTRIWNASHSLPDTIVLTDAEGVEVPTIATNIDDELNILIQVLTPEALLVEGETYTVLECDLEGHCDPDPIAEFTVTAPADESRPSIPEETFRKSESPARSSAPSSWQVTLDMEYEGPLLFIDEAVSTTYDEETATGVLADVTRDTTLEFGTFSCLEPGLTADAGEFVLVRFGTVDAAGNFSGWGELTEIGANGCACSNAATNQDGPARAVGLLLLLAGAWYRRRSEAGSC